VSALDADQTECRLTSTNCLFNRNNTQYNTDQIKM